jgi:exodeoxyribonuclease-5
MVLKSKLVLGDDDYCGTIHSLIYRLVGKEKLENGRTELYFDPNEAHLSYDLIIVDEASMVNEWMFRDLSSHGIKILAVGDHGQLPPVKGSFNLMENPDIKLETILRQVEGNPIIGMAILARREGNIAYGAYGHCLKTRDTNVLHNHPFGDPGAIMLCALNKTRNKMNSFAREKLKIADPFPVVGEPLICLFNNNSAGIHNGSIGILKRIQVEEDYYDVDIDMGGFVYTGHIDPKQFGKPYTNVEEGVEDIDYFDWAYVTTVHKFQGSEADTVLLIEEGEFMFKDDLWKRWLYTGCSRAKKKLTIYKR